MKLSKVLLFSALSFTAFSSPIQAETDYPTKTIRFMVPYAAGGPLDNVARLLGEQVEKTLGQPIVVENKAGAGGNIGLTKVAKAKSDGYYLGMGAVATMAINPWIYPDMAFDPKTDLEPIILLASVPNVLILNKEFAEKNNIDKTQDFVDYLKNTDQEVNYASGGNGSAGHLAAELFKERTQTNMEHIPYQGANPAKMALLGGQTQLMFDNLASALPQIKSDDVKVLAVTSDKRSTFLEDTPTLQEEGLENFDIGTWFGVVTTAGTPDDVVQKINKAYTEAFENEEVQKQLKMMGSELVHGSSKDFKDMAQEEYQKYEEITGLAGAINN